MSAAAPKDEQAEPPGRAGRPGFAEAFPREPALDALVVAFAAGNYARVRREAPELARQTSREDVRNAARLLVEKTRADPLAVFFVVLTGILLVVLSGWWWKYNGPSNAPVPPPPVERIR